MKDKNGYYKILGVSKNATTVEIKQAYRRAALRNHPDFYPNDEEKLENIKRINEAYSVLGNPKRRAEYDRDTWSFRISPQDESFQDSVFNPYKNYAYMLFAWAECWFKYTIEVNRFCLSIISSKHL